MARARMSGMTQDFFSDVDRWQRHNPRLTRGDGLLVAYCITVWVIGSLTARTLLSPIAHSPVRSAVIWCLAALTSWFVLPPAQLLIPLPILRRALRIIVSAASLATGAASLSFLHGIWIITHAPSLHLDYMKEVTLPAIALFALGTVGLISLLRPTTTTPTG